MLNISKILYVLSLPAQCEIPDQIKGLVSQCNVGYDMFDQEERTFRPGWKPMQSSDTLNDTRQEYTYKSVFFIDTKMCLFSNFLLCNTGFAKILSVCSYMFSNVFLFQNVHIVATVFFVFVCYFSYSYYCYCNHCCAVVIVLLLLLLLLSLLLSVLLLTHLILTLLMFFFIATLLFSWLLLLFTFITLLLPYFWIFFVIATVVVIVAIVVIVMPVVTVASLIVVISRCNNKLNLPDRTCHDKEVLIKIF